MQMQERIRKAGTKPLPMKLMEQPLSQMQERTSKIVSKLMLTFAGALEMHSKRLRPQ
jgi:hypothetical protein